MTWVEIFDTLSNQQQQGVYAVSVSLVIFMVMLLAVIYTLFTCLNSERQERKGTVGKGVSLPVRMMLEIVDKEGWEISAGGRGQFIQYKNLMVFVSDDRIVDVYIRVVRDTITGLFTKEELKAIHPKYLALRKSLHTKQDKTSLTDALTNFTKAIS